MTNKFYRRFSMGHPDDPSASMSSFARLVCASSKKFQDEIADVYFGRAFRYNFNGSDRRYGDVMGKEASDAQVKDLLDMQEQTGVPISLTINEMNFMPEISGNKNVRNEFVKFVKSFYEAGVRICTISDVHLMTTGVLQEAMPDMHWKNTVNHIVRTAQEVVDYASIGYNTILIDRSLNRDADELRRVKAVADKIGVKLSLLASEGCMPSCPYKKEHDSVQPYTQNGYNPTLNPELRSYWGIYGDLSCNRWRFSNMTRKEGVEVEDEALMPRQGTDIVALDKETLDVYLDNTHVLKFSGRLSNQQNIRPGEQFFWGSNIGKKQLTSGETALDDQILVSSFSEIYERNLFPFHTWRPMSAYPGENTSIESVLEQAESRLAARRATSVWGQKKAAALNKTLLTCKNQCYDCHACERVFGYEDFDTLLELEKPTKWTDKADNVIPIRVAA